MIKIQKSMIDAFASHVITEESRQGVYRTWICRRPTEGHLWFRVTTIPGYLVLTGDCGTMALCRCYDMIPWLRGAIRDPQYVLEKSSGKPNRKEQIPLQLAALIWFAAHVTDEEECHPPEYGEGRLAGDY